MIIADEQVNFLYAKNKFEKGSQNENYFYDPHKKFDKKHLDSLEICLSFDSALTFDDMNLNSIAFKQPQDFFQGFNLKFVKKDQFLVKDDDIDEDDEKAWGDGTKDVQYDDIDIKRNFKLGESQLKADNF